MLRQHPAYGKLIEDALTEVARTRGYDNLKDAGFEDIRGFIFVSSAESTTPFHADSDENFFFQIHGDKFFHVYDNRDRSIASEEALEDVVVKHRNIPYEARFDAKCMTYNLKPGDGVFVPYQWPALGAHRKQLLRSRCPDLEIGRCPPPQRHLHDELDAAQHRHSAEPARYEPGARQRQSWRCSGQPPARLSRFAAAKACAA